MLKNSFNISAIYRNFICTKKRKNCTFCAYSAILFTHKFCLRYTSCISCLRVHIFKREYMNLNSVVDIFKSIAPLHLAEEWDNVGLLIEPSKPKPVSTICLTNDLTENVLTEALSINADLIFCYHPPIFRPLKSLNSAKWKDKIIIKCIENGIALYSPHTALDAVEGGVNDWLISCFETVTCKPLKPCLDEYSYFIELNVPLNQNVEDALQNPGTKVKVISNDDINKKIGIWTAKACISNILEIITKSGANSSIQQFKPASSVSYGLGRYAEFKNAIQIQDAINIVKKHLNLKQLRVSFGNNHKPDTFVSSVAVCAGSGSSVLHGAIADLYVTGEMSHHDLLDAIHNNGTVILCEHSNTERGFLNILCKNLEEKLSSVKVISSITDKDPVVIL